MPKQYLDANGNPISAPAGKVYLDPNTGEPVSHSGNLPAPTHFVSAQPQQTFAQKALAMGTDLAKGAGEGLLHTISGTDDWAAKHLPAFLVNPLIVVFTLGFSLTTPIGQSATPENQDRAIQYAKDLSTPINTTQKVGRGIEQAAEFLAPSGIEEAGAKLLVPTLGKLAGRAIPAAIGAGIVNKAQGGTFTGGAAAGGIGSGVATGLGAIAPALAESALGTRRVERAMGKNPGLSVLEDTSGIRPSTIDTSAKQAISDYGQANKGIVNAFDATPGNTISIQPGRDVVNSAINKAASQNSKGVAIPQALNVMRNLTESPPINPATGLVDVTAPNAITLPLSANQTASAAENIKRGLRTDYISNFNPEMMKGTREVANQAAGAIDGSLDAALGPEYAANNDKMSGLYSVTDAMLRRSLDPSTTQKLAAKGLAHTGAAAGGLFGAGAGYKEGGVPGAVLGGVAGFAGPELLLGPEAQMIAARTMFSPATRRFAIPSTVGLGSQFFRPKDAQ